MAKRTGNRRLFQRITTTIKRQIADGRLVAGERLPAERDMAQRQQVSRVSVRDAYRSLEELGVITIRRGTEGGAYVAAPDPAAIQQSLSLMLRLGRVSDAELSDAWMIEPMVARLAARNARDSDIVRLGRALEREEAAVARRVPAGPHRRRFQRAVAACARNLPLTALLNSLADLTETAGRATGAGVPDAVLCRSHRAIFEAIERRDEQAAYQLTRLHAGWVQTASAHRPPRRRVRAATVRRSVPSPGRAA